MTLLSASEFPVLICFGALLALAECNRGKPGNKTHLHKAEKYFAAGDYGSAEVE